MHATDLTKLQKALSDIVGLAELLHKGVRKPKPVPTQGNASGNEYENIPTLVIQAPIPDALEHTIHFLFEVIKYMSSRVAGDPPGNFSLAVGSPLKHTEDALELAQKYLIEEADQSALESGLGPVVTPEAINLLLLERLSHGVYRNGTINVVELYERIVEKLVSAIYSGTDFVPQVVTDNQYRRHRLSRTQVGTFYWSSTGSLKRSRSFWMFLTSKSDFSSSTANY